MDGGAVIEGVRGVPKRELDGVPSNRPGNKECPGPPGGVSGHGGVVVPETGMRNGGGGGGVEAPGRFGGGPCIFGSAGSPPIIWCWPSDRSSLGAPASASASAACSASAGGAARCIGSLIKATGKESDISISSIAIGGVAYPD